MKTIRILQDQIDKLRAENDELRERLKTKEVDMKHPLIVNYRQHTEKLKPLIDEVVGEETFVGTASQLERIIRRICRRDHIDTLFVHLPGTRSFVKLLSAMRDNSEKLGYLVEYSLSDKLTPSKMRGCYYWRITKIKPMWRNGDFSC